MKIQDYIKDHILLFDGAMGTWFASGHPDYGDYCEAASLTDPEFIAKIHREYLEAGCNGIKTNTFAANPIRPGFAGRCEEVIRAACRIAQETIAAFQKEKDASRPVFLFGTVGPIIGTSDEQVAAAYREVCDVFLDCGITNFLFETHSNDLPLPDIVHYLKERRPDAFIITSFAVQPDGYTRDGLYYTDLLERADRNPDVDAAGMNCVSGALHMKNLTERIDLPDLTLSIMPNAGYPRILGNRTFYDGDPSYFAEQLLSIADDGAAILGGCCGTTPDHIRETARRLRGSAEGGIRQLPKIRPRYRNIRAEILARVTESNRFWNKLESGKKVIAVELDPPRGSDGTRFMSGAWTLKAAGVDAITIADCATAHASIDSSLMACKIKRELDLDVIPHMTCRDRNLNATKALLLGLSMEGIRNVLTVTGDPIPTAERDEVKSVYQFNSRLLAGFIHSLNKTELDQPFHIYGALNLNARHFEVQLRLGKEKISQGITAFLTQPVLTEQGFENLKLARRELDAKILGGIIPVVSSRNARFMDSEINGISVDPKITEMYEGKSRAECTQLAIDISSEIARRIAPYVDGYYLITPFMRTDIITAVTEQIRAMEPETPGSKNRF